MLLAKKVDIVLPSINDKKYVMFLDDLIRYHFHIIFNFFEYTHIESHMIKVTRDAELDMEGDVSKSYINKIVEGIKSLLKPDGIVMFEDPYLYTNEQLLLHIH